MELDIFDGQVTKGWPQWLSYVSFKCGNSLCQQAGMIVQIKNVAV